MDDFLLPETIKITLLQQPREDNQLFINIQDVHILLKKACMRENFYIEVLEEERHQASFEGNKLIRHILRRIDENRDKIQQITRLLRQNNLVIDYEISRYKFQKLPCYDQLRTRVTWNRELIATVYNALKDTDAPDADETKFFRMTIEYSTYDLIGNN